MNFNSWYLALMCTFVYLCIGMEQESPQARLFYKQIRNIVFNILGESSSPRSLEKLVALNKLQETVKDSIPFPCNTTSTRSPIPPKSVHRLRPGDIDVIAAMGDSLTAANGAAASNLFEVLVENRGLSWSIGGQGTWRQFLTLPNILKEFNPNLIGYSLGDSLSHHPNAQFNVAEPWAKSEDMPFMAKVLVSRIKADKRVDFENHWKLVTVMIGPNDFCLKFCYLPKEKFNNIQETHRRELISTLDYLRDNLPRTLVNLVPSFNLESMRNLKGLPNYCNQLLLITCPCLFGLARDSSYTDNIAMQIQWQRIQKEVANDKRYRKKCDFAVVLQPFSANFKYPEIKTPSGNITDISCISEDCFHASQKCHALAANGLWNNMLEPVGKKSKDGSPVFSKFLCPTKKNPYIFTHKNSC